MSPYARFKKVGFSADGSCAYVVFDFEDRSEESLCLLFDKYAELVRGKAEFSLDEYENIAYVSEYSRAVMSGLRSLSCAPCTKKALYSKLRQKKFSHDASEEAVNYIAGSGYIDEKKQVSAEVSACIARKYGPMKIKSRLISKGYPHGIVERVMQKLEGYDFTPACLSLARARGVSDPFDRKEKSSTYAYLQRCGYDNDCIKRVLSVLYADT